MNVGTNDVKFISESLTISSLTEEEVILLSTEGNLYHPTPSDLKMSVDAYVHLWRTGDPEMINTSPIGQMFTKLVSVHKIDVKRASSICDHYLRLKVYMIVSDAV